MSLTVDDIKNKEFNNRMRGYDKAEVDSFLNEVSSTITELNSKIESLQDSLKSNEGQLQYFTELKDSLNKSILVAQEAADKVKNNAKKESDIMIREAQKQATDIVSEANAKANQVIEDTASETKKLTTETNDLKKQTRIFRQRLQVMLESQLEVVKSDDWDELLATDDLSKYDEIQKILGTRLDSESGESVQSSSTAEGSSESPTTFSPADFNQSSSEPSDTVDKQQTAAPADDSDSVDSATTEPTEASEAETTNDSDAGTTQPSVPADDSQSQGQTVVIFPDADDKTEHN